MSKSLSSSVACGFVARASSKTVRMRGMRPKRRATRVSPLSYLSNTGMITTSLITSQASMSPVKSVTSLRIRARCASRISSSDSSSSHGEVLGRQLVLAALAPQLAVGERDQVEADAAEEKLVRGLLHHDVGPDEGCPVGTDDRDQSLAGAVLHVSPRSFRCPYFQPLTAPVRPPTMRRSNRLKNASAGSMDSDVKARTFAVSTEYCEANACTPRGNVNVESSFRMNSGSR